MQSDSQSHIAGAGLISMPAIIGALAIDFFSTSYHLYRYVDKVNCNPYAHKKKGYGLNLAEHPPSTITFYGRLEKVDIFVTTKRGPYMYVAEGDHAWVVTMDGLGGLSVPPWTVRSDRL